MREKLQRIQELGPEGECPVCTQTLNDHYEKVIEDLEKQLKELRQNFVQERKAEQEVEKQLGEMKRFVAEKRRQKEEYIEKLSRSQEAETALAQLSESLQEWEESVKALQSELQDLEQFVYDADAHQQMEKQFDELLGLQQRAAGLRERIQRKEQTEQEKSKLQTVIEKIKTDIQLAEKALNDIDYDPSDYEQGRQTVEMAQKNRDGLRDADSEQRERLAELKKDLQRIEQDLSDQAKKEKEKKAIQTEIDYLQALENHFGRFRLELAGRIRPLISRRTSELLSLTTDGRYSLVDLDEDYKLTIFDGNLRFPITHFSGGEQDLANLCLRIAISQVIAERSSSSPISLIVLDEVFGSQDDERRALILNAFHQLKQHFRQIFLITHVEGIKDVLPVIVEIGTQNEQSSFARLL